MHTYTISHLGRSDHKLRTDLLFFQNLFPLHIGEFYAKCKNMSFVYPSLTLLHESHILVLLYRVELVLHNYPNLRKYKDFNVFSTKISFISVKKSLVTSIISRIDKNILPSFCQKMVQNNPILIETVFTRIHQNLLEARFSKFKFR